jgi:hypothetical protein
MRRGGFYAAFREGISCRDDDSGARVGIGTVRIKLFNLLIAELGPLFLGRGIIVPAPSVTAFLAGSSREFRDSCTEVSLNSIPADMAALVAGAPFRDRETARLTVVFDKPRVVPEDP